MVHIRPVGWPLCKRPRRRARLAVHTQCTCSACSAHAVHMQRTCSTHAACKQRASSVQAACKQRAHTPTARELACNAASADFPSRDRLHPATLSSRLKASTAAFAASQPSPCATDRHSPSSSSQLCSAVSLPRGDAAAFSWTGISSISSLSAARPSATTTRSCCCRSIDAPPPLSASPFPSSCRTSSSSSAAATAASPGSTLGPTAAPTSAAPTNTSMRSEK